MITFKLNGLEVQAEQGSTILDVARFYGLEIPNPLLQWRGWTPGRLPAVRRRDRRGPQVQAGLLLHLPGRGKGLIVHTDNQARHRGAPG